MIIKWLLFGKIEISISNNGMPFVRDNLVFPIYFARFFSFFLFALDFWETISAELESNEFSLDCVDRSIDETLGIIDCLWISRIFFSKLMIGQSLYSDSPTIIRLSLSIRLVLSISLSPFHLSLLSIFLPISRSLFPLLSSKWDSLKIKLSSPSILQIVPKSRKQFLLTFQSYSFFFIKVKSSQFRLVPKYPKREKKIQDYQIKSQVKSRRRNHFGFRN